jgi:hypothetical protein
MYIIHMWDAEECLLTVLDFCFYVLNIEYKYGTLVE